MATTAPLPAPPGGKTVRPVYAIFEGGGAKGITHLGALKALEAERFALVGAAGTSAGAIIAALAAVGYTADELFSGNRDVLSDRNLSPLDLMGRRAWARLGRLRRSAKGLAWSLIVAALAAAGARLLPWAEGSLAATWTFRAALAASLFFALGLLWVPWRILRHDGLFTTEAMRDTLNGLLRDKLAQHYRDMGHPGEVPELIRFVHLDPTQVPRCCRLKIVATDSRSGQMVLFDHNTASVVVADAVAASAAIPFLFAPPKVRGLNADREPRFVDGGLISNLPAWSFRTEKRALEREQGGPSIPIFAFTLAAPGEEECEAERKGLFRRFREIWAFLKDVIFTGIFGSQAVVQGFIDELAVFPLPSPLSTLSFDCTREEATLAYESGLSCAGGELRKRRRTESLTRASLEAILADVASEIGRRRAAEGKPVPSLRMSLVDPLDPKGSSFRVTAAANMDSDADDRLELDLRNDIAPRCYDSRVPVFGTVQGRDAQALWMTKYERALVRADLCSVICVPVFANALPPDIKRPPPLRVLCLDSSDLLEAEFNDATFVQMLVGLAVSTSPMLIAQQVGGFGR